MHKTGVTCVLKCCCPVAGEIQCIGKVDQTLAVRIHFTVKFFFTQVVSAWNTLTEVVDIIVTLKRLLDRHMVTQGMEGYGSSEGRGD